MQNTIGIITCAKLFLNRPVYSCLLSALAFEWQRGVR